MIIRQIVQIYQIPPLQPDFEQRAILLPGLVRLYSHAGSSDPKQRDLSSKIAVIFTAGLWEIPIEEEGSHM